MQPVIHLPSNSNYLSIIWSWHCDVRDDPDHLIIKGCSDVLLEQTTNHQQKAARRAVHDDSRCENIDTPRIGHSDVQRSRVWCPQHLEAESIADSRRGGHHICMANDPVCVCVYVCVSVCICV